MRSYRVTLCIAEGNKRAYVEEIFEYRMSVGSKNDSCYLLVGSLMECCFLVIQDDPRRGIIGAAHLVGCIVSGTVSS